jgi:Gpi18-like mannosyltransferase
MLKKLQRRLRLWQIRRRQNNNQCCQEYGWQIKKVVYRIDTQNILGVYSVIVLLFYSWTLRRLIGNSGKIIKGRYCINYSVLGDSMNIIKKHPLLFISFVLFGLSLFVRYRIHSLSNEDVVILEDWYRHFYRNGKASLANGNFSNYTPLYLYLLWITRLFSDWFSPIEAIKIIPTAFDVLSAFTIFQMTRIKFDDDKPYLFSAIFFVLPTIMFNSTGWGQIESLYTSFLLLCTYFLLKEKPMYALMMFGLAFSVKSQSIFFLPFLGILFLKGKIRWFHFLFVPIIYILLAIPAAWIGRSWSSIFSIYIGQIGQFRSLSMSAPNLYVFVPDSFYEIGVWIGMGVFLVAMAAWGWINWRAKVTYGHRQIMLMALAALTLVPFVLPKMHDRYFYPADVFSFATVIFVPEMWFIPLCYQLISSLSYSIFILNASTTYVKIAALINTGVVIYILYKQYLSLNEVHAEETPDVKA